MTNKFAIPQAIYDRSDELNALVENYPRYIPVPEVAKFLGANAEGLRHRSGENEKSLSPAFYNG